MQLPITINRDDRKQQLLANHKESEKIHKLVVKIISWKTGNGVKSDKGNKISPTEWGNYKKHLLRISKTESKERVLEKIKAIHLAIKSHNGFK